jgi:hypothetical protein
MSLLHAVFTSQIDDLECLAAYLGLEDDFTGKWMQKMAGLTSSQLSELRSGKIHQTRNAEHSRVLGDLARTLAEHRQVARASGGPSGATWLTSGTLVRTSKGRLRPIEVFSDPVLALEALDELRHTLEG